MWAENFNKKHTKFGLIAMSAILFAAVPTVTISLMSTEDAFARNGMYTSDTSQAAAVDNECLNPIFDSIEDIDNAVGVGNCGATVSQQDESGQASAPITLQNSNPTIELRRATTTTPSPGLGSGRDIDTCVMCFERNLNADQAGEFVQALNAETEFSWAQFNKNQPITSTSNLCEVLDSLSSQTTQVDALESIQEALQTIGVDDISVIRIITDCIEEWLGL